MGLIILTKSPQFNFSDFKNGLKSLGKYILGQKRGPSAVTESLILGLKELKTDFLLNPPVNKIKKTDIIYVNESASALRWAIKAKERGWAKKIVVGPAITVLPYENKEIMMNKSIDLILFPSNWVRDFWLFLAPGLSSKIKVWPAGVIDQGFLRNQNGIILIYNKNPNSTILNYIIRHFNLNKIKYRILNYGHYRYSYFPKILKKAKAVVFLSHSESQGLSLHEVWMAGIPTLVWNPGFMKYGNFSWENEKISAPYLTEECGLFFKNDKDFDNSFLKFIEKYNSFKPREYSLNNFTNKICADNFLQMINNNESKR